MFSHHVYGLVAFCLSLSMCFHHHFSMCGSPICDTSRLAQLLIIVVHVSSRLWFGRFLFIVIAFGYVFLGSTALPPAHTITAKGRKQTPTNRIKVGVAQIKTHTSLMHTP